MQTINSSPIIACKDNCIKFTFSEFLSYQAAVKAVAEWKQIFVAHGDQKFVLVFNALAMKDYEPMARSIWQKTMKEHKSQIHSIWVVTDSRLIATGAMVMGAFTSFTIKTVSSESEVQLN